MVLAVVVQALLAQMRGLRQLVGPVAQATLLAKKSPMLAAVLADALAGRMALPEVRAAAEKADLLRLMQNLALMGLVVVVVVVEVVRPVLVVVVEAVS